MHKNYNPQKALGKMLMCGNYNSQRALGENTHVWELQFPKGFGGKAQA